MRPIAFTELAAFASALVAVASLDAACAQSAAGAASTGNGGAASAASTSSSAAVATSTAAVSTGASGLSDASSGVGSTGGNGGSMGTGGGTTASSSSSSASGGGPCAPGAQCPDVPSACIALTDYSASTTPALRMSQLDISQPAVLAAGIVASIVSSDVGQELPACNLMGAGTFNWIFQLDLVANTLTTGGADPVPDPTQGYTFVNGVPAGTATLVTPVTAPITYDKSSGMFANTTPLSLLNVPIFLDDQATQSVILPLRSALVVGTLSSDHDCIGSYNAATLLPANMCQPVGNMKAFTDGGEVSGYMTLADADSVVIDSLNQTLCAVLCGQNDAGSPAMCVKNANGQFTCKGNYCSTSNPPGPGGCEDSFTFAATFAASAVKVM